jgi:Protein of unknown function (DUF2950)
MRSNTPKNGDTKMCTKLLPAALLLAAALPSGLARAADQKSFATPAEAVQALVKSAEDGNQDEMMEVLGDAGKELVFSGDAVQDDANAKAFLKAYKSKHAIVTRDKNTRILEVGVSAWPMPIPIVNDGGRWKFDTAAGKQEVLIRRIGHNELGAIAACRGFIDAQKDYAAVGHDGLPAGIYAQKLLSDPDKQNGLYWQTGENEPASPAGPLLAQADATGYDNSVVGTKAQPYHGYLYRILKEQGTAAKGGAKSYLSDGKLARGVALVGYPVEYRVSGVMTFIINQNGIVYQKDLGEKTSELAGAITEYNPDSTWKRVTD